MSVNLSPSRAPSGSPAFSPANRPVYRGGGASGSTPYPLSFAALGLTGVAGRVIDGSEAGGFYTDSAMTTEAVTSNSDPVGGVADLSGNARHLTQATSANKPVFVITNGIKGYRSGLISGVRRHLEGNMPRSQNHTYYAVYRRDGAAGASGPVNLRQSSPLFAVYHDSTDNINVHDNGVVTIAQASNNIGILKASRTTASIGWSLETFAIDGTPLNSAANGAAGTTNTDQSVIHGGSDADDREAFNVYFEFECDSEVTAGQHSTIIAHISSRFGGLT